MPRFAILDPLTLMGQAVTTEIQKRFPEADLSFFHTSEDEEHQIASVAENAALVPPLTEEEGLSNFDVVVLTADRINPRLKVLETALKQNLKVVFIDASSLGHYRLSTSPSLGVDSISIGARVRPAHPSVVVASAVIQALDAFKPTAITIGAVEPVSIFGKEAVTTLAYQAAQRLQGENVVEMIDDQVAAFNMTARSGADLSREATELFPGIDVAAARTLGGSFHGHFTLLSVTCSSTISLEAVTGALKNVPGLSTTDSPLRLDGVIDRDGIWLTSPEISPGGRTVVFQAMVDGTQVGGAETVAAILERFTEN